MFAHLWRRAPACPINLQRADLSSLDDSLSNLRRTAAEVTQAAASAAVMLEQEHQRTKACFIAMNAASDAILILDRDGNIFFCNDQFMNDHGIDHYNDVVGLHVTQILPEFPEFDRVWQSVRNNHTEVVVCPETSRVMTIVPMMNGEPKPIYYACTIKTPK